tara:strand:- start:373 stop:621 length:249 start_codon:yes stop_codon:yes gene_type:complete
MKELADLLIRINLVEESKIDYDVRWDVIDTLNRYIQSKQLIITDVVDSEERTELPAPTVPEFGTDEWIDCCEQLFGGMRKSR